jgi:hypothetical protein
MGGGRAPLHHGGSQHHHGHAQSSSAASALLPATAKKGSVPNGSHIQQYVQPNTIYSLQQAAGANYNSLSLHNG